MRHAVINERRKPHPCRLNCGHIMNYFPVPSAGDVVFCQYCGDYSQAGKRRATSIGPRRTVQCLECGYKRIGEFRVGRARTMAEVHATRHDHWVIVRDGNGQTLVFTSL